MDFAWWMSQHGKDLLPFARQNNACCQVIPFLVVVLSTLKEAYREEEDHVEEVEITREPAEEKAAEEETAAAAAVKVEIVKAPKEAWKKPADKLYWFKACGKIIILTAFFCVANVL